MNPDAIVPLPDVLPLPGPVWLFKFLLHLTFTLHLMAMNFLLGGAILAAVERFRGRRDDQAQGLARWIEKKMPATMAFTVTLGVAPLLFVQALYGHLFYSSSVIMAWPWFLVVPILIVVYSLAYTLSFKGDGDHPLLSMVSWVFALGLVIVAAIYVNNMTLALRPDRWGALYFQNASGWHLNAGDPTVVPRYLHFLLAAMAVAGLTVAFFGALRVRAGDEETGRYRLKIGALWFLIPTALQYVVGFWFLMAFPREVMMVFMGQNIPATILLMASIVLGGGAMLCSALSIRHPQPIRLNVIATAHLAATIVCMVLVRDIARDAMLAPYFQLDSLQTRPQTGVLLLFLVLLVAGLALTAWMVRAFVRASASGGRIEGGG